jgi:hypothetical protein
MPRLDGGRRLVVDRRLTAGGAVAALVILEPSHHSITTAWACPVLVKSCRDETSPSRLEKNVSAAASSKHDPTRPIDWRIWSRRQSRVKEFAV